MRFWIAGPRLLGGLIRPGVSFYARSFDAGSRPAVPAEAPSGFVYVIEGAGGHLKIGVSENPQRRLAELQTGSPSPLIMCFCAPVWGASAYDVEGEAHAILAAHRLSGEWFAVSLNIALAAVYGAAERTGASMQPRAAPARPVQTGPWAWWRRQGTFSRTALVAISGAIINTFAMPPGSGFLIYWVIGAGIFMAFT